MDIVEDREGDVLLLSPVGRLDTTTSRDFEKKLLELVNGGNVHFVIDFAKLDYVSSAGLRVLVMLGKRLPGLNGSLVLSTLSPQVREVFDIAGFTRIFQIVADRKQALAETERQRLGKAGKAGGRPVGTSAPKPAAGGAKAAPAVKAKPAAKPAAAQTATPAATPAAKPAAKPAPAAAAPANATEKAEKAAPEPAKPRQRSVEELAIELLRKGEAPPFLEQGKKSK
jgi:anti-anti-sigma factor